MTDRVCIHGHYYQPDRTNPRTGAVDRQPSAAPFRDWNERVTAECYAPNALAGNYERTSFDFGPTLLAWLEREAPETYAQVLAADRAGRERFDGHGPAITQNWAHSILPLDSERDRRTQVRWGVSDFRHRFGRDPEGMWLAETAVDVPTLETLAAAGIGFTVLAPHQVPAGPGAYRCPLPSGREIALFAYDGAIAGEVAFGDLLADGERMAARLLAAGPGRFVHVATDGETFGHHHRDGELALARCLDRVEAAGSRLTVYGRELADHPPREAGAVVERSSWSCVHGVERWRRGCGCSTGLNPGWQQDWRAPLRAAVEWLRDAIAPAFGQRLDPLLGDPWAARDDYIEVILDPASVGGFLARHAGRPLVAADRELVIGLLEMQRWALLAFASCGWFFDDISELTAVQVMRCAGRAVELCRAHLGIELEEGLTDILHNARSNVAALGTGADIYRRVRAGP
jgi:alpha-amylase/alpha-mannosidase (GH57 family)